MNNWSYFLAFLCLFTALEVHPVWGHLEENPLSKLKHNRVKVKLDYDIVFHASPSLLNQSGEWVKISWSSVFFPTKDDWVGVWVLPNNSSTIDATKQAPIKFQYCSFAKTHSRGYGEMKFHMVNMRGVYQFGLFRGGFKNPIMAAVSNTISFQNPNEPLHGHLALTGNETEMMLMWNTRDAHQPQAKWGTTKGHYSKTKNATSSTYTAEDMCDTPAMDYGWTDPGKMHKVLLDGLIPGTRYYYIFGDDSFGWSDEFSFKAAPTPGPSVTTKVLAVGDMGHGAFDDTRQVLKLEQPSIETTKHLVGEMGSHDLLLHVGDLSYADGYEPIWDEYFHQVKMLLAGLPYMVNPGNHESDSNNSDALFKGHDSGGECNVPYINRFAMPRPGPDQPWYGFDFGCIHVVMMSTEHNFTIGSKQYTFLARHMESVNRTKTPWLIFSGHRPMYIDSTNETEPSGEMPVSRLLQANIEPLLKRYKVDLAFWGHHHTYQRMCPVFNNTCTEGATTHIVIGMGGRSLLHNLRPIPPKFVRKVDEWHWGYSRFVANTTTLVFEYIQNNDGQVHDTVVLRKN